LPTDIKWPNDVLVSGRKLCGILVESAIEGERLDYAVMGIGVNLGQASFPVEIADTATSLLIETGRSVPAEFFIVPLLERLEYWYRTATTNPDRCIARWEELSSYARGCRVRIESIEGAIEGITDGLASSGALIVELANGEKREIVSGDVRIRALGAQG
jgi:BirA family biotin operon repressor/biotin-[acetyl-CoA-carboxylase] ligase